jgi:hypothetical protein
MNSYEKVLFLERLLFSKEEKGILKFYSHFRSSKDLIKWMKKRPRQKFSIYEVSGNKNYIVLIPTKDHTGPYASNCLKIYKGLHIVFLESTGPFFSYARTINFGFKYIATKYKPKWIIISNDDMLKIDEVSKLKDQLDKLDEKKVDVVYISPGNQQSAGCYLVSNRTTYKLYQIFFNKCSKKAQKILDKFDSSFHLIGSGSKDIKSQMLKVLRPIFFKTYAKYVSLGSCWVASNEFVKKQNYKILDDTFIIDTEQDELVLRSSNKLRTANIKYKIGNEQGATLGSDCRRSLQGLTGIIYLNYKFKKTKLYIQ